MANISENCLSEALAALKNFNKEDLQDYVRQVFTRARSYSDVKNMKAFERAMSEINNEKAKSYFEDATIKANNIMKFERNAKEIRDQKLDMRSLVVARGKKLSMNISMAQKAEMEKTIKQVLGDLTHDEVEHWSSGKFDQAICDLHDGKKLDDPVSQKIADKLKDYFVYRNAQMVLSNAMKFEEINEDRLFRAIHDQERIINGAKSLVKLARDKITKQFDLNANKEAWKSYIKKHLDMEETFKNTPAVDLNGNLIMSEADKILDRIFQNITTGKSEIFTRSIVANDREAIAKKSKMFFKWKDLRSQFEYNKVYGKGNLFNMFMSDAKSASNKVGAAKMWGDNPYSMYNDLRKVQEQTKPMGSKWWDRTDRYFKAVMGLDKGSVAPTATNMVANLKMLTTMARLPLITFQSISDIGYIAAFAQRIGINYTRSWMNQISHLFDTFQTEDRMRIAKLMKMQVDSHLGYIGRWGDQNNVNSLINRISTRYFKVNLLHAFDQGNRVGMMTLLAKHLYENSGKSLDKLDLPVKNWVSKFLDENEWDILRKKNSDGLFTTENADNLTNEEVRNFYEKSDKSLPMSEIRDDLNRKIHAMFTVAAENAVLTPSEFEHVFFLGGTKPGTNMHHFWQLVSQFKMYPLAYIDRVLLNGYRDADAAGMKLKWGMSMLMGTIPLAVLSTYFSNILMGHSSNFFDMWNSQNVPQRGAFLLNLLQPSLAAFSGVMDPSNQNPNVALDLLSSPSIKLIGNAMASGLALGEGDAKRSGKKLMNALSYIAPIQTTPIVSPLLNQAMGTESHVDPGQSHIFGG